MVRNKQYRSVQKLQIMAMQMVQSHKGKNPLAKENHLYRSEAISANTMNCKYKQYKWKARLAALLWNREPSNEEIITRGEHSHHPDPAHFGKNNCKLL